MNVPVINALILSNVCKYHHILLKTRFFGLHFYPRHYRSIFNHLDVIGPKATKFGEITQKGLLRHWRSFKVTDFGTGEKLICRY